MKPIVVCYSLTGNNAALATCIAGKLQTDLVVVSEPKPRTTGTTIVDLLFNRSPKVHVASFDESQYDFALFVGPVWIGHPATPLRRPLKTLVPTIGTYGFATISGGADGPNMQLGTNLKKLVNRDPALLLDLSIAKLLPQGAEISRKVTSAYRITDVEVEQLAQQVVENLKR